MYSKIPANELHKNKETVNKKKKKKKKKDINMLVICSEIPHSQILHHVANRIAIKFKEPPYKLIPPFSITPLKQL